MLHNSCRTFQQIYSNRLQLYPFLIVNDRRQTFTHYKVNNACQRFHHLRCDVMTQKNQTQSHDLNTANLNYRVSSSTDQSEKATKKLLPFDAIPCADGQSNSICGRFYAITHQLKQLLTAQWDNRFHEEIDECHRRYGPIFRKSLAQNQG